MNTARPDWIILRCAGASTVRLATSLVEAGFDVWTPVVREVVRTDEQRTREVVSSPIMAGYAFAQSRHLLELLALARNPAQNHQVWDSEKRRMVTRGHPYFSVFKGGNHRFIPDRELEPLRCLDRKSDPAAAEQVFEVGEEVRTDDAGFIGLTGKVVEVRRKTVVVSFGKWGIGCEFPTWALRPLDDNRPDQVNGGKPECDTAKAA